MIEIQVAAVEAAEGFASLHREAFEAPWSATELATLLSGPGSLALSAWIEGHLAGFVLCRAVADEAEVLTLASAPAARRRGVAKALLAAAQQVAASRGVEALFLEVAADNQAALALYRGLGFRQVGARAGYYRPRSGPVDALIMRRDLNR